jgi:HD-GYP domain-containing protein (c-di-GMP phosphodiesterase class II)
MMSEAGIPEAILNKPFPLTEEEWVIMKSHLKGWKPYVQS